MTIEERESDSISEDKILPLERALREQSNRLQKSDEKA